MRPRRVRASASAALALVMAACGSVQPPVPTPSTPDSRQPPAVETMVVGVHIPANRALGDDFGLTASDLPLHSLHPNGSLWDAVVGKFVYSAVYRADETQFPVPDLAEAQCEVSDDLLVITCALRDATFHDGAPLTADDVAFNYQLLLSDACRMPFCATGDFDLIASATALDERTVEFRLAEPNPGFVTAILPDVLIEPRALVEVAFAEFVDATDDADPAALESEASRLAGALHPEDPARPGEVVPCDSPDEAVLADAERAIAEIGRRLRSRDAYATSGEFDACAYGDYLGGVLTDAADALSSSGIDAIAAAYRILEPPPTPVGSGPWRVVSIDPGESMELEAFDAYHHGSPAAPRLEVRLIHSTAEAIDAVRSGEIDWLLEPFTFGENLVAAGVGDTPGVAWMEYNALIWYDLEYNLREGRLFADANLRAAMELCVDKDETVAAATGGQGVPIYSPILPSMWAFEPDVPRPRRDPEAARALIEASGWTPGVDGIYYKGDQRLSATVPMLEGSAERLRFLELLAFQVVDCGIEIIPQSMSEDDFNIALTWPLVPPGADRPWDAVFSGWLTAPDPDPSAIYHSRAIATASNPIGFNYIGYASDEGDALMEEARATYDPRERARLYREYQRILARDRPVMYAWSPRVREARSARMESTQGPLTNDTSTWWWELEALFVRATDP